MENELILFMITVLEKMPLREDLFKDDKYVFSYILKSLKNKYICVNKKSYFRFNNEVLNNEIFDYTESESIKSDIIFQDMIKGLSECERKILNKKYVFNLTESDISRELKTSRQYINKVHKKALGKLRDTMY